MSHPRPLSMPPNAYTFTPLDDHSPVPSSKRRDSHPRPRANNKIIGNYTLAKTLGAGSMGKVKLATHNVSGEKLAVKILPRVYPLPPSSHMPMSDSAAKQAAKDTSKEIRTLREAALSMLLYHPYICGMRELIVHQHHYYMVFEYVNGGQMLDYIISHGRLRERVARKFARQIASAIDYCHQNNVVHRDLKIENILISQTGNIKIIDFGLSNLYDPLSHLSTFCGSLYFAAPELLNARVYTGPEVDIWSFGVVLYVLVCGKVPFDDQSMPALHAKIKRGLVEYPVWLTAECKHLLSRMLVTNPSSRATLRQVLDHPWMVYGYSAPPDPHLVHREPLRSDELDKQVIKGMNGFEFGSEDEIQRQLVTILESERYIKAVHFWERKRGGALGNWANGSAHPNGAGGGGALSSVLGRWGESLSNSSLAMSFDSGSTKFDSSMMPVPAAHHPSPPTSAKKTKRFSGLDWYRRKWFPPSSHQHHPASPPVSPSTHSTPDSYNSLHPHGAHSSASAACAAGDGKEPPDPTRGFHPLISMYYLAREKLEREKVYGPGVFASSQLSMVPDGGGAKEREKEKDSERSGTEAQKISVEEAYAHIQPSPVATSSRNQATPPATPLAGKPDYGMPLPRLPVPESSHYSAISYDPAAASPTSPTFNHPQGGVGGPQPRARDFGGIPPLPTGTLNSMLHQHSHSMAVQPQRRVQDDVQQGLGGRQLQQQQEKDSGKLLPRVPRAPPAVGHRRSHSLSQRPSATSAGTGVLGRGWGSMFGRGTGGGTVSSTSATMGVDTRTGVDEYGVVVGGGGMEEPRTEVSSFAETEEEDRLQYAGGGGLASGGALLMKKFGGLLIGGSGAGVGGRAVAVHDHNITEARKTGGVGIPSRPLVGDVLNDVMEVEGEREDENENEEAEGDDDDTPIVSVIDDGKIEEEEGDEEESTKTPTPSVVPIIAASTATVTPNAAAAMNGRLTISVSQPIGSVHRRAATILDPHTRRGGGNITSGTGTGTAPSTPTTTTGGVHHYYQHHHYHERRGSTGGAALLIGVGSSSSAGAELPSHATSAGMTMTPGRVRRPSTGFVGRMGHPWSPQQRQLQPAVLEGAGEGPFDGEDVEEEEEGEEEEEQEKEYKPVYLKGLFSVATTSSKAPATIKVDIRRVLDRMQVQYRETKNGFECIHSPSIDVASVNTSMLGPAQGVSAGSGVESRPSIVKKASKLSFGMKRKEKERKEEGLRQPNVDAVLQQHVPQQVQGRPSEGTIVTTTTTTTAGLTTMLSSGSSSFLNVSSHQPVEMSQQQSYLRDPPFDQPGPESTRSYSPVSNKSKVLPPIPRDFTTAMVGSMNPGAAAAAATPTVLTMGTTRSSSPLRSGQVGKEVFESIAKNQLSVRFEITIVKVPLLPLYGIQFRRASGDGWQYQMMARRVLTELKL